VGKSRTAVTNYMRLLKLPAQVQMALKNHEIDMGHARALLSIESPSQQIKLFKEVQRLKTQLDQYTDLSEEQAEAIGQTVPTDALQGFRSMYLETAKRLKEKQDKPGGADDPVVEQLDFEFVLFASAVIDYDYIMGLIARYTQNLPGKLKMSREQLIGLIQSDAKFIDEREDIAEYIRGLSADQPLDEKEIRAGYEQFKAAKKAEGVQEVFFPGELELRRADAAGDTVSLLPSTWEKMELAAKYTGITL
jgi:type I restriction enzyme R subunit